MFGKQSWWEFRQTESFLNKEPAFALYVGLKLWVKYSASEIFLGKFFFLDKESKTKRRKKGKSANWLGLKNSKPNFVQKPKKPI